MKITQLGIFIALSICTALTFSCRDESEPDVARISKLTFEESAVTAYIGQVVKVNLKAEPGHAKKNDKVEYKASEAGIVEIKQDSSNDGVVFEALRRGKTIITAGVNGVVDFCEVTVGGNDSVIPHIIVPDYVIEARENERRSLVVSLAGGTPLDDHQFLWTYTNQNVINLETTGNVGVFDALQTGESVITVSHPKAQFSVNVLVYIVGNNDVPTYITTNSNVVNINVNDTHFQYTVNLNNGNVNSYAGFVHEILEGKDIIDLSYNSNIATIYPKVRGIARIGVRHSDATYQMEIVVIVNETIEYTYIDVDKTLVIMEKGNKTLLTAQLMGDAPESGIDEYSISVNNDNSVSIFQSYNHFEITALERGSAVLTIKNKYADFAREVLVIVNDITSIFDNEMFITTNQNVITTEIGSDVLLTMMLVGGVEADRNNFVWTVDDGSIIDLENVDGKVNYRSRAITNIGNKLEAQAMVIPKKTGTAYITLENPKSKNSLQVIVKVYARGTFGAVPVVVDGLARYLVEEGGQQTAKLRVVTGREQDVQNVQWMVDDTGIASVTGSGLTAVLQGKKTGITTVRAYGANMRYEYSALVVVSNSTYFDTVPFIYVLQPYMAIVKGATLNFNVMCENMSSNEISAINVVNNSPHVMDVLSYRNSVTVVAHELGEGEIIISGTGINTVIVKVTVEDYKVNPDMPFYLRSEKAIYGMVKGRNIELSVDLVGGSAANENNIIWKTDNPQVAVISGAGASALVSGKAAGQTVVTVSHPKSNNELRIVAYVVENDDALLNAVVLYAHEQNILLELGESRYISLVTNANDQQKTLLQWDISGADNIDVMISGDKTKAMIGGARTGNATISVKYGNNGIPLVLYVSVVSKIFEKAYIGVPSIIEMVAEEMYSINAAVKGIGNPTDIEWSISDNNAANIHGNGMQCLVIGLTKGNSVISVKYKDEFAKDILLFVYGSYGEMMNSYVIAGEQSRYILNEGDTVNIGLTFGMRGFPDYETQNIRWQASDNNVIQVNGNGKNAQVRALREGIGTIMVSSNVSNAVEIEVEVRNTGKAGQYWFNIDPDDKIVGIRSGNYKDIAVRVFNGSNEVFNISGIEYVVEHGDIITVAHNGDSMHIQAAYGKEGQSYITIRHSLIEDTRILVYTYLNDATLSNMYPLFVEKTNYLIQKNDVVNITIGTIDNNVAKINNISYVPEKTNIIAIAEKNKREIAVTGIGIGSDVIHVRYNGITVQKLYISVTDTDYSRMNGYLITESIIALLTGTSYETSVNTNIGGSISWYIQNAVIASVENTWGNKATINGRSAGITNLTIKAGQAERNILVAVCENETQLKNLQLINISQRYFRIQKGESLTIPVHSYQGKVEGTTGYGDYYQYSEMFGGVIELNSDTVENNRCDVVGIREGVAAILVVNRFYDAEIIVYVEVYPAGAGSVNIVSKNNFITSDRTLYVIGENERNVTMSVDIVGDPSDGHNAWQWYDYDSNLIRVEYQGKYAMVSALGLPGTTQIKVRNDNCTNILSITVIVGDRYNIDDSLLPYIYVEKNVFEVAKNTGNIIIPYSIVNVPDFTPSDIGFVLYNNDTIFVRNDINSMTLTVTVHDIGLARIDIKYGNLTKDIYIMVKDNAEYGNVFLTTSENYVIVGVGELKTTNIELVGYDEIDPSEFKWSINRTGVAEVIGNGTTGQIYGIAADNNDVVLTVRHKKAPYELKIYIKVVVDKIKSNAVYLTTQRNVIETVVNDMSETLYVQKVGGNIGLDRNQWTSSDSAIVAVTGSGPMGQYTPLKKGIARITVSNEETNCKNIEIVIIVREGLNNGIYISTSSNLIKLSPTEAQRRIGVTLVNGDPLTYKEFTWEVHNNPYNPDVAASGGRVIDIITNNEECFIRPLYEGTATITVRHRLADSPLYITAHVSFHQEMKFDVSSKYITIGSNEIVGINIPTYENLSDKVVVSSNDVSVLDVYYTNEAVLLYGKKAGSAVVNARINGRSEEAQLAVVVLSEDDLNVNKVVVEKMMYVINLDTPPMMLNALVSGPGVSEHHHDEIVWTLNKMNVKDSDGVIDMFPITNNEPGKPLSAQSRQIQIRPKELGTVNITVSSSIVDEGYHKTISIIVADKNLNMKVSHNEVTVTNSIPKTVSVDIVGATTKDYQEVKWVAEMQRRWDGTLLEVVRVIGSGKEVILYPMNEGVTDVYVHYRGQTEKIRVNVTSDYYFSFRTTIEYMYPGEIREFPFDVKPSNAHVNWISSNGDDLPVITYAEVLGSAVEGGQPVRYLRVEAKREGAQMIVGMANGKLAQLTIVVQYDYSFKLDRTAFGELDDDGNGTKTVGYTIWPPDTYIKPVGYVPSILQIIINQPDLQKTGDDGTVRPDGKGTITFNASNEIEIEALEFRQYKKKSSPNSIVDEPVTGNLNGYIHVRFGYPNPVRMQPYFVRGVGVFSNRKDRTDYSPRPGAVSLYQNRPIVGAESITVSYPLGNDTPTYTLYLGDGEEHYILFDKSYPNASIALNDSMARTALTALKTELALIYPDGGIEAELVDITHNGVHQVAIRLSGGNDYIEYNRVKFSNELFMDVRSPYATGTNASVSVTNTSLAENGVINRIYTKNYDLLHGQWDNVLAESSADPWGQNHGYQVFYFINNATFQDMYNIFPNIVDKAKHIKSDSRLVKYWNDSRYTYYFTGSEIAVGNREYNLLQTVLRDYCTKANVYPAYYRYSHTTYIENKSFFDSGRFVDDLRREYVDTMVDGEIVPVLTIIGGSIVSAKALTTAETVSEQWNMVIYKYSLNKLLIYSRDEYRNTSNYINIENWDRGIITPEIFQEITGRTTDDDVWRYSTIDYRVTLEQATAGGVNYMSRYNVLRDYYVDTSTRNYAKKESNENGPRLSYIGHAGKTYYGNFSYSEYYGIHYVCYQYNGIQHYDPWHWGNRKSTSSDFTIFISNDDKRESYSYGYRQVQKEIISDRGFPTGNYQTVTERYEIHYGQNRWGPNIFGPVNSYGAAGPGDDVGWSPEYHNGTVLYYSHGYWNQHRDTTNIYSEAYGLNRLSWINTGHEVIVPYYIFNRFPFRYERKDNVFNYDQFNAVDLRGGGGKPMPSIEADVAVNSVNRKAKTITLAFNTYNDTVVVNLEVIFEKRPCHMQLVNSGNKTDSYVNASNDNNGFAEPEGPVTSWMNGNTVRPEFANISHLIRQE